MSHSVVCPRVWGKLFWNRPGNYEGNGLAAALQAGLTTTIVGYSVVPTFLCVYDQGDNRLKISLVDPRAAPVKAVSPFILEIYTDAKLVPKYTTIANTVNTIIGNTTERLITEAAPYTCYLDLFNTRNLYLTSSALCSYDTVSNFGTDLSIPASGLSHCKETILVFALCSNKSVST